MAVRYSVHQKKGKANMPGGSLESEEFGPSGTLISEPYGSEGPQPVDSEQNDLYPDGYGVRNVYHLDPGVCVLPIAEDPPADDDPNLKNFSPVVIARLHAPYRIRRTSYSTKKVNNPPVIPSPEDSGAFVFMSGDISFFPTLNTTFRNFDWDVTTEYMFVENCVSRPKDGFVLGSPPWTWISSTENMAELGGFYSPAVGAVALAGPDVKIGYTQGVLITGGSLLSNDNSVTLIDDWGYNTASYFSGAFLNADMVNG